MTRAMPSNTRAPGLLATCLLCACLVYSAVASASDVTSPASSEPPPHPQQQQQEVRFLELDGSVPITSDQPSASLSCSGVSGSGSASPSSSCPSLVPPGEPDLPVIRPLDPLQSTKTMTPEERREYLHSKVYTPPPAAAGRTLRTRAPKFAPQPSPVPLLFNSSNAHLLPRTSINLRYIPRFLSQAEAAHFISLGKELGFSLSPVLTASGDPYYSSKRTSTTCFIPKGHDAITRRIERRTARMLNIDVELIRMLQVVEYLPGQFFDEHMDGNDALKLQYTVFAYLNSVPYGKGGETEFLKLNIRVQPEEGNAVFWENFCPYGNRRPESVHVGRPPLEGLKYGLNVWVKFDESTKPQ